eukprot:gnl/Hemi2/10109_TR3501_c0_g1_i1.p1 gnl/Hemi2/10109_TR3501_c0_g1~~gnl/Hemi2/10109_TR3501_c0_g1_i1.p1  ORF type:complete len:168 (+),score=31.63 gnl/Hemi2/10109_TR3501_c0_g1_i1:193-696(+)
MRDLQFHVVGVSSPSPGLQEAYLQLNLPTLRLSSSKTKTIDLSTSAPSHTSHPAPLADGDASKAPTMVISSSLRGGQPIRSLGDLVIMGSVNAGAEVFADGDIHIYGCLRGRAHAGHSGYKLARIFAASSSPEYVSVCGVGLVGEEASHSSPTTFFMENGKIKSQSC